MNNFIKPGLEDLCVSRTSFKWGIPVTFDTNHVIYVWVDALSNYISALGYWNEAYNDFDKFWPADVHMVAKDIMRFHAIIWPAMLMALDLPLPKHLAVHGWITFNGQKMSKSLGNVVDPLVLADRYGADAIRYHILREMALGADSSFSNEIMINRINSDLANGFGNLVSRTVAMVDRTQLNRALEEIFQVVSRANKYIDETAPWILAKDEANRTRLATVLYHLLEVIRIISTALSAFMPTTMPKVWEQIGATEADVTYEKMDQFGVLPADVTVQKGEILFPRIDVDKEIEELNQIISANLPADQKPEEPAFDVPELAEEIDIETFAKVDLRVAKVTACEKVKKSKKLLRLQLDDGMGGRQVVSGIAPWYAPEDLIGKKIVLVANLKPAKLCGVESCGMICAADGADGAVKVLFADESLPCGAKVR